ncbi:TBC1 domain family member 20 isoform X5 [Taeniopygia guttata]|uniref:TBC1 domain family member 20 isoform X5 n=1 Tax=Taeniopygia guttata TaxID=59729 RepID=UPI0011AF9402
MCGDPCAASHRGCQMTRGKDCRRSSSISSFTSSSATPSCTTTRGTMTSLSPSCWSWGTGWPQHWWRSSQYIISGTQWEERSQLHVLRLWGHLCRDFMYPTMDNTKQILNYLMLIIDQVNPEVHDFMKSAEVGTIFALSWLITWFGHVLSDFRHVVRLYDFFLACHPLMPIYFAAVIVLHRKQEVLDCECDMASVHHLLCQIPQDLPYESLISKAGEIFVQFPPSKLTKEAAQAERTAASTFKDFELASVQQRPDTVLRQRFRERMRGEERLRGEERTKSILTKPRTNRFVKLAVMGLTVALGAAALAMVKSALEWAPKFQLQIFP